MEINIPPGNFTEQQHTPRQPGDLAVNQAPYAIAKSNDFRVDAGLLATLSSLDLWTHGHGNCQVSKTERKRLPAMTRNANSIMFILEALMI